MHGLVLCFITFSPHWTKWGIWMKVGIGKCLSGPLIFLWKLFFGHNCYFCTSAALLKWSICEGQLTATFQQPWTDWVSARKKQAWKILGQWKWIMSRFNSRQHGLSLWFFSASLWYIDWEYTFWFWSVVKVLGPQQFTQTVQRSNVIPRYVRDIYHIR